MQLRESGARNQVANFRKRSVTPQAHARACESHPDCSAAFLHGTRECTVVNHFPSNRRDSPDAFERFAAQQNAAARRARGAGFRIRNPARRIEHQEKIKKWRNQQALGKTLRL